MPNPNREAAPSPKPKRLLDLNLRFERLGVVELPEGSIRWLSATPCSADLNVHDAGSESLRFEETGSVPVVRAVNDGAAGVHLPSETVLRGGLQTRMVARSVVVPAGSRVDVPVRCVERARWAPDARDQRFSTSTQMSSATRSRLRRTRGATDQATVWHEVDKDLRRTQSTSRTSSYEAVQERLRDIVDALKQRGELAPPADANGALLLFRRGFGWLEVFPHRAALHAALDGLLSGLVDQGAAHDRARRQRSSSQILNDVLETRLVEERDSIGAGSAYLVDGQLDNGHVVLIDGRVAHLAARVGYEVEI